MKQLVSLTRDRALSTLSVAIDSAIAAHEFGFFYQPEASRSWLSVEAFRDEVSWTIWLGKFELIWDRPRLGGQS